MEDSMGTEDKLIDQRAMSERLGITTKTAETWRSRGFGPRYVKVGSLVRYRLSDIETWAQGRTVDSTSKKMPKDAA